ncbi:MAG: AMP-binding protein [Clostridiales bacterium]|nr:AMP-binding protein [Clostridiales bacterium]
MNKKRYKNKLYETRYVNDIKDLIYSSTLLFSGRNAYLVKDQPGGDYKPITYQQLKEDMNALGTALLHHGLEGKKIAVIGENRYEWVLTYLAVCCGVGVIVPIERELHPTEIKSLIERSGASAVVFSGKSEEIVNDAISGLDFIEYKINMDAIKHEQNLLSLKLLLEQGKQLVQSGNRDYIDKEIKNDVMSILLFTSGTTGVSKGVMLSHKNIMSNVMNMSKMVNVEGQIGLSVLPMHHTYEMTCHILTALYQGCCVAICEGLKHIVKNMVEARANVMLGVPLLFESMYNRIWKQAEKSGKANKLRRAIAISKFFRLYNTRLPRLIFKDIHDILGGGINLLISGAAAIDPKVVEDFNAMGLNMIQGYGLTESSPIVAVNKDRYSKWDSVGLPMPGTEIRIENADENGIGEIVCKSDSVMLGYFDDPEATAEALKDGWLHTGDYGYLDKDNFLYITGRKKNVIVTKNGKNIFPEEIEYHLGKSDFISECVVYGLNEEKKGEVVVCAEIFPNYEAIKEKLGHICESQVRALIDEAIEKVNNIMPLYKRVRRFNIRDVEFEKTPTKKIKRHLVGQK